MGFGRKIDPEPGRCRRTDGKKWRCSKEAYPDSKYCERHMHRGRNRSRKPVEVNMSTHTTTPKPPPTIISKSPNYPSPNPHPLSSYSRSMGNMGSNNNNNNLLSSQDHFLLESSPYRFVCAFLIETKTTLYPLVLFAFLLIRFIVYISEKVMG